MEKQIAEGNIGSVGSYDVDFKEGKLVASAKASPVSGVDAALSISVDSGLVIDLIKAKVADKLKEKIPGTLDDMIIDLIFSTAKDALK
jgi:hypothetical protein